MQNSRYYIGYEKCISVFMLSGQGIRIAADKKKKEACYVYTPIQGRSSKHSPIISYQPLLRLFAQTALDHFFSSGNCFSRPSLLAPERTTASWRNLDTIVNLL